MKRRNLRLGILITTILTYISSATAQITVGDTEYDSLLEFFVEFYGIPTEGGIDLMTVGYLGGFLLLTGIYYFAAETVIRRSGSDSLLKATGLKNGINSKGGVSRRLAVLSLLAVVSTMSIGATQASIVGVAGIFAGGIGILIFVFGLYSIAFLIGGTRDAGGLAAKEVAGGINDLRSRSSTVDNLVSRAERDTQQGNTQQAEMEFEKALEIMEQDATKLEELFEKDFTSIRADLNQISNDFQAKQETAEGFKWIEGHEDHIREDLEKIVATLASEQNSGNLDLSDAVANIVENGGNYSVTVGPMSGNRVSIDGLNNLEQELQQIQQQIQNRIGKWETTADKDLENEIDNILSEAEVLVEGHEILRTLKKEIKEAENEDQALKDLAEQMNNKNLFRDAKSFKDKIQYIENEISQLESEEAQIESEFREIKNGLQEILNLDESERGQVKKNIVEDKKIKQLLERTQNLLSNSFNDNQNARDIVGMCSTMETQFNTIDTEIQNIFNASSTDLNNQRQLLQKLDQMISKLNN